MSPLKRAIRWVTKSGLGGLTGGASQYGFVDSFRHARAPSRVELVQAYKNIAYTCASKNAVAVASTRIGIYVETKKGQRSAKSYLGLKDVSLERERYIRDKSGLGASLSGSSKLQEVTSHPLITLLNTANNQHTKYDLIELTTLYQEICGDAFWSLEYDSLGVPVKVYPLQAHMMSVVPDYESTQVIKEYIFSSGIGNTVFKPEDIIHFKYCSLVDPYVLGWSPLRAAFEHSIIHDKMLAYEEATLDNRARPDMLVSPKEPIGQQEAMRLERKIQNKFRWGGGGGVLVGESGLDYKPLVFPPSDLAALQLRKVSKEEIANAFQVPISLLRTEDVNRANAEAGNYRHAIDAVRPRCIRMQERINKDLCPKFDPDGRLFVAFDDPVPENETEKRENRKMFLMYGVKTINEIRAEDGLSPVKWGEEPILPITVAPLSHPIRDPKPAAAPGKPGSPKPKPGGGKGVEEPNDLVNDITTSKLLQALEQNNAIYIENRDNRVE